MIIHESELYHHGIKGQKWGVRRYQNEDGTMTEAGKKRYAKELDKRLGKLQKDTARLQAEYHNAAGGIKEAYRRFDKYRTEYESLSDKQKASWRGRRLEKKGKDWLTRSIESAAIGTVTKQNLQKNIEETNRLLNEIQHDQNLLTYQQRRSASAKLTKSEKTDARRAIDTVGLAHNKKIRRTYDYDYASDMEYDRTRVRYASDKERKKNAKRRTERRGSQLVRHEYFYY